MYIPRFCPYPQCEYHKPQKTIPGWWVRFGFHDTNAFGPVQRYRCCFCRRTFSRQTFRLNYYAKKRVNYRHLLAHITAKSGIRQISRAFRVSCGTVQNRIGRLSRQAIRLHEQCRKQIRLDEDLVADGFESFAVSQYFPDNINLLVGKDSQFVYLADYVTIRRKGRMTEEQLIKREELEKQYKADPRGIEKSFTNLVMEMERLQREVADKHLSLYTDKKQDYSRSLAHSSYFSKMREEDRFRHVRISSRKARTRHNPLFAVNYIDREIRKGIANHVRETTQFTRNVNDGMSRLLLYFCQHNYQKPFRIRESNADHRFHGEVAGLNRQLVEKARKGFFSWRAFYSYVQPEGLAEKQWLRGYDTPLKKGGEYLPKHVLRGYTQAS